MAWQRSYTLKEKGKTYLTEYNKETGEFRTRELKEDEKKPKNNLTVIGSGAEHQVR